MGAATGADGRAGGRAVACAGWGRAVCGAGSREDRRSGRRWYSVHLGWALNLAHPGGRAEHSHRSDLVDALRAGAMADGAAAHSSGRGAGAVDPLLVAAIIKCESSFNPMATSRAGAMGLMQLMPETAEEVALEKKIDLIDSEELYKPEINIEIGFYYIKKLRERYSGSLVLALAAYNAGLKKGDEWAMGGPGKNVGEEINRITYPETKKFVTDVLKTYSRLKTARKIKRLLEFE